MAIGVLVVDDSSFFRQQICKLINSFGDFEVVGTAINGADAIKKAESLKPGVITMDYEMPGMDGITAIREIMAKSPTPILMLSSLSYDGAKITLDALDAGAADYLLKDFESFAKATTKTQNEFYKRIRALTQKSGGAVRASLASLGAPVKTAPGNATVRPLPLRDQALKEKKQVEKTTPNIRRPKNLASLNQFDVMVIGCSTGGPAALTRILASVSASFPLPIVIGLHMPEYFTETFAKRLDSISKLQVKEAQTGDVLKRGRVLLAPGGKQLVFDKRNRGSVRVLDNDGGLEYAPCVDVLFASAAKDLGKKTLSVVLTGMGSDGKDGAKLLKKQGATIWVQDEQSSVVYGMPGSIVKNGLADSELSLDVLVDIFRTGT
ncbi:MAG: chemotaxis response regulator protein-glutamate methylesterase [Pseudomonadales bacterium]|nr:chemotaxis response regulator protein-glutamate methylesterase [Pseudomonadales bacterium]